MSTRADTHPRDTYALKLVPVTAKTPAAFAATVVALLIVLATLTFPHGLAVLGRWTLARTGFPPVTPRAGATAAWALTWNTRARTRAADVKTFENILIDTGDRGRC